MRVCAAFCVFLLLTSPLRSMTVEERRQYLENLLKTLPEAPSFRQWLQSSGELPPDFDALPRTNDLPHPLRFLDGKPVRTPQEWHARRGNLDADVTSQSGVLGAIDNAHPAFAELFGDAIASDGGAQEGHGSGALVEYRSLRLLLSQLVEELHDCLLFLQFRQGAELTLDVGPVQAATLPHHDGLHIRHVSRSKGEEL